MSLHEKLRILLSDAARLEKEKDRIDGLLQEVWRQIKVVDAEIARQAEQLEGGR